LLCVSSVSSLSVDFFTSVPPTILAKRINPSHLLDLNFDKQSDDLERSTFLIYKRKVKHIHETCQTSPENPPVFFVVGTMAYILTVCQDSEVLVEIKSVRLNVSSVLWHAHSAFVNPGV